MEKIDKSVMISLELIRTECDKRRDCDNCPYSCLYYCVVDGKQETHHACVLNEVPECWQLETMEGYYNA